MPTKAIVLSKLDVDELLDLINNENTEPELRAKAIRFLRRQMPAAE